ncbi:MAG: hypothetical protein FWH12_07975 [Treponema sp.]|nr:hypothetical protein [Treponema sp.]
MKKIALIPLLLLLIQVMPVFSNPGISLNIRFYDRRVYYLEEDPILLLLTITNNSPSPFRFRLAEERVFSVDFDVRTSSNRAVDPAEYLVRRRSGSQQVFFREVTIETGESFSFVEDLRNYAAFAQTGAFVVQARLYPELNQAASLEIVPGSTLSASGAPLESNRLSLSLRHRPLDGPEGIPLELDLDTNAILMRERLPPDEVISYLLTARQRGEWEKFFLYLDLEAMLSRDGNRRRQWQAESEEGRRRMLERYRLDLQNSLIDGDITLIPRNFIIERTTYSANSATVSVLQYFQVGMYVEEKRYTWYLERQDGIWHIVDYTVLNLGTE